MEFIGRESVAYLGYLYCRAEWGSMKDLELNQILILWNVKGMEGDGITLGRGIWSLFELLVCNSLGEWDFSFLVFFRE